MRRWRVAAQTVHNSRFCRVERDPFSGREWQGDEERLRPLQRVEGELLAVFELDLKGELADERAVFAAGAPEPDGDLAGDPVAEVQRADVLEDFLDDRSTDERD